MSWKKVKLGDFLTVRENRYKPNDPAIDGLKRIHKIDFSGLIFLSDKDSNTDMILVKKGDLVISGINVEKGAMSVYQGDNDIAATIHYSSYQYDPLKIDIGFLKNFLRSTEFRNAIKEQVPGGIKTEIKPKHFLGLHVDIPDTIKEQKSIVASLQTKNSSIKNLDNELIHQLDLVKKLRKQLLQEAMQGKLIQQDPKDEPAAVLLKKIKAEKEQLINEKKLKKEKLLLPIKHEEIPFEIPNGWEWCHLSELITCGPTNGYSPQPSKLNYGVKCLTLSATTTGKFNGNFYKYTDVKIDPKSPLWLTNGDILIQRGNSLDFVGIAALYDNSPMTYIYPDLMIKIRVSAFTNSEYIHKCLITPYGRSYFQKNAFGSQKSMPKIKQDVINKMAIPLPPVMEQIRIVQKIDQLMKYCDELELSVLRSKVQNEKLLRSVLKEVLQGETAA